MLVVKGSQNLPRYHMIDIIRPFPPLRGGRLAVMMLLFLHAATKRSAGGDRSHARSQRRLIRDLGPVRPEVRGVPSSLPVVPDGPLQLLLELDAMRHCRLPPYLCARRTLATGAGDRDDPRSTLTIADLVIDSTKGARKVSIALNLSLPADFASSPRSSLGPTKMIWRCKLSRKMRYSHIDSMISYEELVLPPGNSLLVPAGPSESPGGPGPSGYRCIAY